MQTLSIGRDASNNIVLNDNFVSRQHAQLLVQDNGLVIIKDLGSSNGTFVNGIRITENSLKKGDIVKCAKIIFDWQTYVTNAAFINNQNNRGETQQQFQSQQQEPKDQQFQQQQHSQGENKLMIGSSIAFNLPAMVRNELATLSAQKQEEFLEEYKRRKKSVGISYLFQIFIFWMHYGYLRKWGLQFVFWFTGGGFGIWWFIDLFRNYGMVTDYNKDIAIDVIRNLKAISN